jgi:hypothetical protein
MFCPQTGALLEEVTTGEKLQFITPKTGIKHSAGPADTLLLSEEIGEIPVSRYKNTLTTTAFDPTNSRVRLPNGCEKCKRKVVSCQRLGEEKRMFYSCLCGNSWHN